MVKADLVPMQPVLQLQVVKEDQMVRLLKAVVAVVVAALLVQPVLVALERRMVPMLLLLLGLVVAEVFIPMEENIKIKLC